MDQAPGSTLILGIMSGTSLDGLDLALCEFFSAGKSWQYRIHKARTVSYDLAWKKQLSEAKVLSAQDYFALHAAYGIFVSEQVIRFLSDCPRPAAIASHGHTVFHQPARGFSTQLGCGATIAAKTGITTVCDFRSLDVALGGQGAPLVPIGDELLFSRYDACLNLGGIANISFRQDGNRVAYDICVANMILNHLAMQEGKAYDEGGSLASQGSLQPQLLEHLEALSFFRQKGARSLGREWFENDMLPLFEGNHVKDLLRTATEHIALRIADDINHNGLGSVLVTGGGAHNSFLLERIRAHCGAELIVPDDETINFKEALIFAFLGLLRMHNMVNSLRTVTGASQDSVGGALYSGSEG